MKIIKINGKEILFDNGNSLTYEHEQDCCESVYADFENIQVITNVFRNNYNVQELNFSENLTDVIDRHEGIGFTIEDENGIKLFVSCYDCQNGYYSDNLSLVYKKGDIKTIIDIRDCEQHFIG